MGSYEVTTTGGTYQIETEDPEPSLRGLAQNAVSNAGQMLNPLNIAKGLGEQVKTGAFDLPKEATETIAQGVGSLISGKPMGETPMAKRAQDIAGSEEVQNPAAYAYKNPLDVAIQAAVPAMAFGPQSSAVKPSPPEEPQAPVASPPEQAIIPNPDPVNSIREAKSSPSSASAPKLPFQDEALAKANEVKSYINRGYQGYAGKPGSVGQVADYIQEKSQMMANQQMGATPLQARQVGHEGMRAIGQYALDNDIVTPTNGIRGMIAKNQALLNAAGEKIGSLRDQADALRNPAETPIDTLQAVRAKLDAKYARGAYSGEAGAYEKALQDVEDSKPTFGGQAEIATKLNQAANKANRLSQPHQPYTDVANAISEINNERIKALLGPQNAAQYEQALREYGVNKKISGFLERKTAGEVKRFGPGSVTSNLTQKAMDELGYKVGARAANKLAGAIKSRPALAGSLPSLFKEFIHQVEDIGNEVTGMAEGGMVKTNPDFEVTHYLQKQFDPEYAKLF